MVFRDKGVVAVETLKSLFRKFEIFEEVCNFWIVEFWYFWDF